MQGLQRIPTSLYPMFLLSVMVTKAPWPNSQYKGEGGVVHVAIVMYHAAKNGNQITAFGLLMEVTKIPTLFSLFQMYRLYR